MTIRIEPERPDTPEAMQLIEELEAALSPLYPQESRHGYSVAKLLAQGVAFFVTRQDGEPVGCGGIQVFGVEYGELKRMYVRPAFRGLGLAAQMLEQLSRHARQQGIQVLRLETGIHQHEAIGLYERHGFQRRPPFGDYQPDPLSLWFEKVLA